MRNHKLCVECFDARHPGAPAHALVGDAGTRCCVCGLGPARIPYRHAAPFKYCRVIHGDGDDAAG